MNYLLYQAYGNKDIINEAIYSIFSYFQFPQSSAQIIIYTDDVNSFEHFFQGKGIIYRPLTKELIHEWRGEIDFVHRVKIKMLQDFFSGSQDANLLYIDSDTVFISDPSELFHAISENNFVMHTMEGIIKERHNLIFKKVFKYLYFNDIILSDSGKIRVPLDSEMWNAGVIGINDSQKEILNKVLDFTDSLYPKFPKHIVEQFAFSYYFQTEGNIVAASSSIYHYWNFKEFRQVLSRFFEKYKSSGFDSIMENLKRIDPSVLIKPKLAYETSGSMKRLINKIKGKSWEKDLEKFD